VSTQRTTIASVSLRATRTYIDVRVEVEETDLSLRKSLTEIDSAMKTHNAAAGVLLFVQHDARLDRLAVQLVGQ
jgi:hypothetical protein